MDVPCLILRGCFCVRVLKQEHILVLNINCEFSVYSRSGIETIQNLTFVTFQGSSPRLRFRELLKR